MNYFLIFLILILLIILAMIGHKEIINVLGGFDYIEELGINEKEAILFIPGLGNGHESFNWDDVDEETVFKTGWERNDGIQKPLSKNFRTFSFDPPGIRKSDGSVPFKISDYCEYIHKLTEKLNKPFTIIAHSIGCIVARVYYDMYPEDIKRMIFLDPTPDFILDEMEKPDYYTKKGGKYDIVKGYIDMVNRSRHQIPDKIPKDLVYVIYNTEDNDDRKDSQKKYIEEHFKNIINYNNKTHFMHVTDQKQTLKDILSILD